VINPFSFQGRLGRFHYFAWSIVFGIIVWLGTILLAFMFGGGSGSQAQADAAFGGATLIASIAFFVITLSLGVRRLHDFDKSGWWYLLAFIPFVNAVFGLILLFAPGTPGANQHGVR
jgi:uncharacterized membrane protein YhaH (DUF805 family)